MCISRFLCAKLAPFGTSSIPALHIFLSSPFLRLLPQPHFCTAMITTSRDRQLRWQNTITQILTPTNQPHPTHFIPLGADPDISHPTWIRIQHPNIATSIGRYCRIYQARRHSAACDCTALASNTVVNPSRGHANEKAPWQTQRCS